MISKNTFSPPSHSLPTLSFLRCPHSSLSSHFHFPFPLSLSLSLSNSLSLFHSLSSLKRVVRAHLSISLRFSWSSPQGGTQTRGRTARSHRTHPPTSHLFLSPLPVSLSPPLLSCLPSPHHLSHC